MFIAVIAINDKHMLLVKHFQHMALRECGLLKFFKVQEMRAQLRLLEYLVHMWDVNEQYFHVGVHTLTLEIDDIYFLTGLSRRGS
jgi:hypothetical protein